MEMTNKILDLILRYFQSIHIVKIIKINLKYLIFGLLIQILRIIAQCKITFQFVLHRKQYNGLEKNQDYLMIFIF